MPSHVLGDLLQFGYVSRRAVLATPMPTTRTAGVRPLVPHREFTSDRGSRPLDGDLQRSEAGQSRALNEWALVPACRRGATAPRQVRRLRSPGLLASPDDFYSHLEDFFDTVSRRVRGYHWSKYRHYRSACRGVRTYPLRWNSIPIIGSA